LNKVLDVIEPVALRRPVSLCCVLLPLPPRPWLSRDPAYDGELEIYRGPSARPRGDVRAVASHGRA
jgi:hypothetical protein